jgi:hypothetical protein
MATFGITHFFKGGTQEQYDNAVRRAHPDEGKGLPPGQTYHAAGPTDGGFLIVAMWDSKASWEKFRDDTLGPVLSSIENPLPAPPEEKEFQVSNEQTA